MWLLVKIPTDRDRLPTTAVVVFDEIKLEVIPAKAGIPKLLVKNLKCALAF